MMGQETQRSPILHNVENYNEVLTITSEMRVFQSLLGRGLLLNFRITDYTTDEILNKKLYIHVRSSHDTVMPIGLNDDL